jgi:hypothetical protein
LKAEVADLMAKAEAADAVDVPDDMLIPDDPSTSSGGAARGPPS